MSSPSTPASKAVSTSELPSSPILTPGAKVRALLAQFDSDQEDQTGGFKATTHDQHGREKNDTTQTSPSGLRSESDDEEDLPVRPRGRLAARMLGGDTGTDNGASVMNDSADSAYARIRNQLLQPSATSDVQTTKQSDEAGEPADEEPSEAPVRRRLLKKRKSSPMSTTPQHSRVVSRSVSPLFFPSPSPSKRVKPTRLASPVEEESDVARTGDDGQIKKPNARFMALVEKQRQKRLEKEAEEARKKADRLNQVRDAVNIQRGSSPADTSEEGSDSDENNAGKKLTQSARPTRKASKKAIEEMHRETQRMSRSMQLTHQAQTKKKLTKQSLLAKFNFSAPALAAEPASSPMGSSAQNSEDEGVNAQGTPPTSPLRDPEPEKGTSIEPIVASEPPVEVIRATEPNELPTIEELTTQPRGSSDKGKGKRFSADVRDQATTRVGSRKGLQRFKMLVQEKPALEGNDKLSDDELEILKVEPTSKRLALFERVPKKRATEARSHLVLRSLAHLNSPGKRKDKHRPAMSAAEMQMLLRKQARQQAAEERAQKIAELKEKGIYLQTSEERHKEQQEIEDLVEKARIEAAEIQKREERKAKKDGTFEDDGLDDDEDEDYQGDEELQLSESDDEHEDDEDGGKSDSDEGSDEELRNDLGESKEGNLVDAEASETDSEEHGSEDEVEDLTTRDRVSENEDVEETPLKFPRRKKVSRALLDSDDEDVVDDPEDIVPTQVQTPLPLSKTRSNNANVNFTPAASTKTPQSILRSTRKVIPGLPLSDDMPIGLTQAFAATMADSQSQDEAEEREEDSMTMLVDLPEPYFSQPTLQRLDSVDMVADSQPASQTQPFGLNLSLDHPMTHSQILTQSPIVPASQFSEIPEPTQDAGYVLSPFDAKRFDTPTAPHSTVETIIIPRDGSPLVERKGRLRRRLEMSRVAEYDDEQDAIEPVQAASVFDKMRQASRRKEQIEQFDKTNSKAKEAFDEAAEESEDEYAGLGGASDDEEGQENEDDKQMINDDNKEKVNEQELAALFADRERAEDSAAVSKLLQDITTGRLRRKRGAGGFDDLDLSDEESAHARRREAKRREFAKMRRELLVNSDERIGKIANDPKKMAFLQALEDRDEDDVDLDLDFHEIAEDSQSQSQPIAPKLDDGSLQEIEAAEDVPSSGIGQAVLQPTHPDTLNRKSEPAHSRRTAPSRRPQTIAEIRESVSFLVEDLTGPQGAVDSDSDSDPEAHENLDKAEAEAIEAFNREAYGDEDDDDLDDFIVQDEDTFPGKQNMTNVFKKPTMPASRAPYSQRRTQARGPVVDRLSLLRQASSSSTSTSSTISNTTGPNSKMAFVSSTPTNATSFKYPSLLRRATSNSSFKSNSETSATGVTTERGAAGKEKEIIRKGSGGQKSSVGYYRNSRVQEREEQMKRRLGGQKSGVGAAGVKKGKIGGSGTGGASVLRGMLGGRKDSWE